MRNTLPPASEPTRLHFQRFPKSILRLVCSIIVFYLLPSSNFGQPASFSPVNFMQQTEEITDFDFGSANPPTMTIPMNLNANANAKFTTAGLVSTISYNDEARGCKLFKMTKYATNNLRYDPSLAFNFGLFCLYKPASTSLADHPYRVFKFDKLDTDPNKLKLELWHNGVLTLPVNYEFYPFTSFEPYVVYIIATKYIDMPVTGPIIALRYAKMDLNFPSTLGLTPPFFSDFNNMLAAGVGLQMKLPSYYATPSSSLKSLPYWNLNPNARVEVSLPTNVDNSFVLMFVNPIDHTQPYSADPEKSNTFAMIIYRETLTSNIQAGIASINQADSKHAYSWQFNQIHDIEFIDASRMMIIACLVADPALTCDPYLFYYTFTPVTSGQFLFNSFQENAGSGGTYKMQLYSNTNPNYEAPSGTGTYYFFSNLIQFCTRDALSDCFASNLGNPRLKETKQGLVDTGSIITPELRMLLVKVSTPNKRIYYDFIVPQAAINNYRTLTSGLVKVEIPHNTKPYERWVVPLEDKDTVRVVKLGTRCPFFNIEVERKGQIRLLVWVGVSREFDSGTGGADGYSRMQLVMSPLFKGASGWITYPEDQLERVFSPPSNQAPLILTYQLSDSILYSFNSSVATQGPYGIVIGIPTGTSGSFKESVYMQDPKLKSPNFTLNTADNGREYKMDVVDTWLSTVSGANSSYPMSLPKTSFTNLPFASKDMIGSNLTLKLISPEQNPADPLFTITSNKQCDVVLRKDDAASQAIDADEIYYTSGGAIALDINRRISMLRCNDEPDKTTSKVTKGCTLIVSQDIILQRIVHVREIYDKGISIVYAIRKTDSFIVAIICDFKSTPGPGVSLLFYDPLIVISRYKSAEITSAMREDVVIAISAINSALLDQGEVPPAKPFTVIVWNYKTKTKYTDTTVINKLGIDTILRYTSTRLIPLGTNYIFYVLTNQPNIESILIEKYQMTFTDSWSTPADAAKTEFTFEKINEMEGRVFKTQYTPRACFTTNYYVLYGVSPQTTGHAKIPVQNFYAFPGESYRGKREYYTMINLQTAELGFTRILRVLCHNPELDMFSVYGERDTKYGDVVATSSLIATFQIAEDARSRLLHVIDVNKVYIRLESTEIIKPLLASKNLPTIFFNTYQFATPEIIRVQKAEFFQNIYINKEVTSEMRLLFRLGNNVGETTVAMTLQPRSLLPLSWTKTNPIPYLPLRQSLLLFPTVLSSIEGDILNIRVETTSPDITWKERVTRLPQESFNVLPGKNTKGVMEDCGDSLVFYVPKECTLSIFQNGMQTVSRTYKVTGCDLLSTFKCITINWLKQIFVFFRAGLNLRAVVISFPTWSISDVLGVIFSTPSSAPVQTYFCIESLSIYEPFELTIGGQSKLGLLVYNMDSSCHSEPIVGYYDSITLPSIILNFTRIVSYNPTEVIQEKNLRICNQVDYKNGGQVFQGMVCLGSTPDTSTQKDAIYLVEFRKSILQPTSSEFLLDHSCRAA